MRFPRATRLRPGREWPEPRRRQLLCRGWGSPPARRFEPIERSASALPSAACPSGGAVRWFGRAGRRRREVGARRRLALRRRAGAAELHGETRAGAQNQQSWPRLLVSIGVSRGWQSQPTCRSCSSSAPGETGRGLFYRRSTLLELDHVFCMVSEPGQAARRLDEDGWMLDAGQTHHGQGTRNRRLAWAEQFLELVWVIDAAEAGANPLRLAGDRASPTCSGLPASWPR